MTDPAPSPSSSSSSSISSSSSDAGCPAPENIMLPPSPPEPAELQDSSGTFSTSMDSPASAVPTTTAAIATTSPSTSTLTSFSSPSLPSPVTPRNQFSPLPRTHLRSRSLAAPPTAPFMTRAHSSPGLDSRGRYAYPSNRDISPIARDLPLRRPSPLRVSLDDASDTILEQPEPHHTPTSSRIRLDVSPVPQMASPGLHNSFPRPNRRRPSSPLNPNSGSHSPVSQAASPFSTTGNRFNEPYPAYSFSSGSSMPSTPTSMRSRSPSISSLETIPDIPDAEAAAIEADQIARLKAAADKADAAAAVNGDLNRRKSSMDMSGSSGLLGSSRFGLGRVDKRKRWSVCGAEGRHDLDLETIWED